MKQQRVAEPWGLRAVTMSVQDIPAATFMMQLAYDAGVSVMIPPGIGENQRITGEFDDQPAQVVFEEVAAQLGLIPEYQDGVVRMVPKEEAHREFVVLRASHLETERAVQALKSVLGEGSTVESLDDRIVVTAGTRALEQARRFAEHWEQGADGWLLDVRVVRISNNFSRTLGVNWNISGRAAIDTTAGGNALGGDLIIEAIGRAVESGGDAVLLQRATLYLLEGRRARLNQGQRVPIPRYSTSPEGTTTTTGYEYITAGFTLEATGHRVPGGIRLQLEPTISSVAGFVGDAPITQESTVEVSTVARAGEWIIISGLETARESMDEDRLPGLPAPVFGSRTNSNEESRLLVLVNVTRVYTSGGSS